MARNHQNSAEVSVSFFCDQAGYVSYYPDGVALGLIPTHYVVTPNLWFENNAHFICTQPWAKDIT